MTPPDLPSREGRDLWAMLRLAMRARRLGRRQMMEVLRIFPMTVAELLNEWFESEALKGVLGAAGITGIFQGPMSAGTAFVFLHHHVGLGDGTPRGASRVRGGIGNLTRILAEAARRRGVEIRTDAPVERIVVKQGRAAGVALASGEEIEARWVASSADPGRTFGELVEPIHLDATFLRAVRNIKYRGGCARVNLALGELPRFSSAAGDDSQLRGVISISPSLRYLERAYDDAKHGALSSEPYLEAVIPTLSDPTLAPPGRHIMSVHVQWAPYHLADGVWDDAKREQLGDVVVATLARHATNLGPAILHRQVLTPLDLEARFGLTEGHIYHGELTLDQVFFMRPLPGWARYRTPVPGLYLCGAGAHPGGGLTARPGYNAARAMLEDVKRRR
jgi:phytoene dehydrogenase-like protein